MNLYNLSRNLCWSTLHLHVQ